MKHSLNRTSPKGQPFVGTCANCGKQGLPPAAINEDCENVRGVSQDDAVVEAVTGPHPGFMEDLTNLINRHSAENGSNTPDFMLASYLSECLGIWNRHVMAREKWYGREPKPVATEINA